MTAHLPRPLLRRCRSPVRRESPLLPTRPLRRDRGTRRPSPHRRARRRRRRGHRHRHRPPARTRRRRPRRGARRRHGSPVPPQPPRHTDRPRQRQRPPPGHRLRRLRHLRPGLALDRPRPLGAGGPPRTAPRRRTGPLVEHHPARHPLAHRAGAPHRAPLRQPSRRRTERQWRPSRPDRPHRSLDFTRRKVRWSRRVPIDTHLANLGSHSIFLVHGTEASTAFLTEEKRLLLTTFPDGPSKRPTTSPVLAPALRRRPGGRLLPPRLTLHPGGLFIA